MLITELPPAHQETKPDAKEDSRLKKSIQELRDLRSQLHYAAEYCETTFLHAQEKRMVVDNTKEYICRAVVTLVDHLGNVSANLNQCISETNDFSEPELRLNCFQQRLLLCEQYTNKLALARLQWRPVLPRHHRRYLSTPITNLNRSAYDYRDSSCLNSVKVIDKHEPNSEALPLFLYTCTKKSFPTKNPSLRTSADKVLPVRDGLSVQTKGPNPTFHFQGGSPRLGRSSGFLGRKSVSQQGTDILSLIRRAKRMSISKIKDSM